jgi:hypothetical protein
VSNGEENEPRIAFTLRVLEHGLNGLPTHKAPSLQTWLWCSWQSARP